MRHARIEPVLDAEIVEDLGEAAAAGPVEVAPEQDRVLRLRADLANLRRRSAQERESAAREGRGAALRPMLDVLDALERALAAGSADRNFYQGVASTHRLLLSALREAGAEPVESLGQAFDPALHEALSTVSDPALPAGLVVRELRRGWRLGDELLRPAQVVVSEQPSPAAEAPPSHRE